MNPTPAFVISTSTSRAWPNLPIPPPLHVPLSIPFQGFIMVGTRKYVFSYSTFIIFNVSKVSINIFLLLFARDIIIGSMYFYIFIIYDVWYVCCICKYWQFGILISSGGTVYSCLFHRILLQSESIIVQGSLFV